MEKKLAVGIDLGTSYCVMGVLQSGRVEIISNSQGYRTTPSYVAFTNTERLIGQPAKNQAQHNPKNTIFDSKRVIGREYDTWFKENEKHWPFTIINDNGFPKFKILFKSEEMNIAPEEIAGMLLQSMKEFGEKFLESEIKDAVITVPAYFNQNQREATEKAGEYAGLNVLRIINEPTAAVLAYGHFNSLSNAKTVLVFDLGGGTFDVSIVESEDKLYNVLATTGDTKLGGEDFNRLLLDKLVEKFNSTYNCDMRDSTKAMERLRRKCEKTKIQLSSSIRTVIQEDALFNNHDFQTTISRADFEAVCSAHFNKTIDCVTKALVQANLQKSDIDKIILVGGSTRIPKIQSMLKDYFGKDLTISINPDEAVAYGAAVQAAMIIGEIEGITLMDVIPLALGIAVHGEEMSILIESNTKKPFRTHRKYYTKNDNQTSVAIKVYEGEGEKVKDNQFLGQFFINNITPAKKGLPINVTFQVNHNGILHVTAEEKLSNQTRSIVIDRTNSVTDEEVQIMMTAKKFKKNDECTKVIFTRINDLKEKCYQKIQEDDEMKEEYKSFLKWIDENDTAEIQVIEKKFESIAKSMEITQEILIE